jgi:hypothetical protein
MSRNNPSHEDKIKIFTEIVDKYRLSSDQTEDLFKAQLKLWSDSFNQMRVNDEKDMVDFITTPKYRKQFTKLASYTSTETQRWGPDKQTNWTLMEDGVTWKWNNPYSNL